MVVADRGFCDLWTLVEKKFYSQALVPILKYTTFAWQANNAYNFIKQTENHECYKVVMCDINDEMIDVQTSLMVGIAREIAQKYQHLSLEKQGASQCLGILEDRECL